MTEGSDTYRVLTGRGSSLVREKASKFIGLAFPVSTADDFKQELAAIRKEHHSARHWCHAYILGELGDVHRSNDDGEPSGTAGRPILRHIQGAGLTNTAVVVVRYFGGTLLGKGGLVQAYGDAAQKALIQAPSELRYMLVGVVLTCTHAQFEQVRADVARAFGRIDSATFDMVCSATLSLPRSQVEPLLRRWREGGIAHCAPMA